MTPDLNKNYFELFDLPQSFEVDSEVLSLRYRDMQRLVHPDRFADADEQQRLAAVQQTAHLNDAFQTLKEPLRRARYLLGLLGVPVDDTDTRMDTGFLLEQMELRERLEAVRSASDPFEALNATREAVEAKERDLIELLRRDFSDGAESSLQRARDSVRKLQFMQRLLEEVNRMEEDLVHEL